jgi:hypothetical protein
MASKITSIYSNIASREVYYDSDVVPRVWDLNDIEKFDGEVANSCPVRVLSVISPESGLESATFVEMGNNIEITWKISDLLLIRPTAHGGSLRNSLPQMINYQVDYLEAIQADKTPTSQSYIDHMYMNRGVFRFPTDESDSYYGVEAVITIVEYI